jgi:predicted membrane-bound spermidine synthase
MTETASPAPSAPPAMLGFEGAAPARPFLPFLVILFVGSGCAALIYEIVWLQMLGLVIGASAISLGVLLATFMGGMCLGSLLFPKFVSRNLHPLLMYGVLELLIGAIGLLELVLVPFMGDLYTHIASPGGYAVALRAVMAGICLLPPTMLMGATLPAIARYVESSPRGVSWLGFFYGGNTLGAVLGCLLAGFYLLAQYDIYVATYTAAVIDAGIGALAILLSRVSPHEAIRKEDAAAAPQRSPGAWTVYVTLGLSGLTGLGAEAIWTRQLSLMLGATVYTFSNILAVFLLGLGIGASVGSFVARSVKQPKMALAWCQFLLAGAIAWAAYAISYSLPSWPIDLQYATTAWATFQVNLAQCFWAVFPGALLWGASFPLGLAALVRRGQDPGKLVGGLYAANTVGAIVGSLLFSMVVMQYFGSQNAQRMLLALCVLSGLIALVPLFAQAMEAGAARAASPSEARAHPAGLMIAALLALVAGGVLLVGIGPPNWGAVAWGRNSATYMAQLYPAVLRKVVPLNAEERKAINEASALFDFKRLYIDTSTDTGVETIKYELIAERNDDTHRKAVDAWLAGHEQALIAALKKNAMSGDEYAVIKDANAHGLRNLKLVNGQLVWNALDYFSVEQRVQEDAWIKRNQADLIAALRQREAVTGTGSILPYVENTSPNLYCVFLGEGMNVSVAVTYDNAGYRYFHGAGKVQASSNPEDMRLQRTLGHISALTNFAQTGKTPQDVLVVACGAGVTAGSFVPYDCNITIVDIEPMVPEFVTPQFADVNHDVIPPSWSHRPTGYKKTNIVIDDGRHFIRTFKGKYDVITSDPIDPWVKGCAALNTVEYYQMCKEHLKPGGTMALWIPFYESSEETTKSVIATFFKVFPNGIIWSNERQGMGYDAVLFGSVDMQGNAAPPIKLNIDDIQAYIDDPAHLAIKRSLNDVHYGENPTIGSCEAVELLATFAGTAPRMTNWTNDTDRLINYDRNLRLQYVAGLHINNDDAAKILNNIIWNYSWPSEIFTGSPEHVNALKDLLENTGRHDRTAAPTPLHIDDGQQPASRPAADR